MERKSNYLAASVLLGVGAVIGDAALDNLQYVRETITSPHSYHSNDEGERKLNVPLRENVRDSLLWGLGELALASPLIALGIGQLTRKREE